jgi:predicted oxidoreductase
MPPIDPPDWILAEMDRRERYWIEQWESLPLTLKALSSREEYINRGLKLMEPITWSAAGAANANRTIAD